MEVRAAQHRTQGVFGLTYAFLVYETEEPRPIAPELEPLSIRDFLRVMEG